MNCFVFVILKGLEAEGKENVTAFILMCCIVMH